MHGSMDVISKQEEGGRKHHFTEGDAGISQDDTHVFEVEFLADIVAMAAVGQQQRDLRAERVVLVQQSAPEQRPVFFVQLQRFWVVLDVGHAPNLCTQTNTMNAH